MTAIDSESLTVFYLMYSALTKSDMTEEEFFKKWMLTEQIFDEYLDKELEHEDSV